MAMKEDILLAGKVEQGGGREKNTPYNKGECFLPGESSALCRCLVRASRFRPADGPYPDIKLFEETPQRRCAPRASFQAPVRNLRPFGVGDRRSSCGLGPG